MNSEIEDSGSSSARAKCVKIPFFIINVITWIGGGGLVGIAIWIISSENDYKHFVENENIFFAYIALAAVLFTAGVLGTCGVLLGNKFMLQSYFFIACLVFCTLFGLVVYGVVERGRVDVIIRDSWNKTNDDTRIFLQKEFDCCGIGINNTETKSYKDKSCYVNETTRYEVKQDCLSKLMKWFEDHQIIIAAGGAAVMFLLILLMIGSCWMIRKIQTSSGLRKCNRVSPEESSNGGDEVPYRREPEQAREMTTIEEPNDATTYAQVNRHSEGKKKKSHQRDAWAKDSKR